MTLPPLEQVDLIEVMCCNLCGSHERQWVHTASHLSSIVEGNKRYDAVLCTNCGLVYLAQTLPKQILETPGKHGGSLLYGLPADVRTREKYFQKQYRRGKQALDWYERHFGSLKGARGLDLLSGCGGVVAAMRERGIRAVGVDPSRILTRHGQNKGLDLRRESIDTFQSADRYDIVFGIQLVNHFLDVKKLLGKIESLLMPDGSLYTETQDFFHAIRRKPMRSCLHVDHPVMFNSTSLRNMFYACRLSIERMATDLDFEHDFGSTNHMHVVSKRDSTLRFEPNPEDVDQTRLQLLLSLSQFQAEHANQHSLVGRRKHSVLKAFKRVISPLRGRMSAA